jgi:hypothetical protein
MEAVFKMPDEWLYIEDGDDRVHERLMEAKKVQVLFKMNEQGQIAAREQSPRRVEFRFVCRDKTLHTAAYVIDPIEQKITREA